MKTSRLLRLVMVAVTLMLMFGELTCRSSRHRTDTGGEGQAMAARERRQVTAGIPIPPLYIDVLVVTDYKLFQQWMGTSVSTTEAKNKITQYYKLVMQGVNRIYGTLAQNGMNISVVMSNIHISDTASDSSWTEQSLVGNSLSGYSVNATKALQNFQTWVSTTGNYKTYDHVVLFTGHKLTSSGLAAGETITGKAFQDKLCAKDGSSLSIVAEVGGFQSVFVAAHELGHSFGALHDGDVSGCSDSQRYLMAVVTQTAQDGSTNPWHFSSCSRSALNNFITPILLLNTSGKRSCLTESLGSGLTTTEEAGQVYSPDQMCRQLMGPQSYYCRSTALNQGETICTALVCYNPNDPERCAHFLAPDGTSCGNRMWCRLGACVSDAQAPQKNPSCVHGDTPYPNAGDSCIANVNSNPWRCYQSVFKDNCCHSCNTSYSGNPACGWGDLQSGCTKQACDRADRFGNIPASLCCQTCGCTGNSCDCLDRHSDCSGVSHPGKCYNETLAFLCCQTCNRLRTGRLGCEYGDYYTGAECRRAVSSGSVDRNLAGLCCETCNATQVSDGSVVCNYKNGVDIFRSSVSLVLLSLLALAVFR